MSIAYAVEKHIRCEIGAMHCEQNDAEMFSGRITEATDNGTFAKLGKMDTLDVWSLEEATNIGGYIHSKGVDGLRLVVLDGVADNRTVLIYQQPIINEESPKALTELENYYNDPENGEDVVRCFKCSDFDRIWLSTNAFVGTPAKDAVITGIQDGKLVIA